MANNNKFKFVNDINETKNVDEMDTTEVITEFNSTTNESKKRKMKPYIRNLRSAAIMLFVSGLLLLLGLLWQDDYTLMAYGDSLWLVFTLEFFAGWVLFVYNRNIFSPLLYGMKSFGLMFLGKRPKTDYYTYMKRVQDDPISPYFYRVLFLSSLVVLIPAVITLFMLI